MSAIVTDILGAKGYKEFSVIFGQGILYTGESVVLERRTTSTDRDEVRKELSRALCHPHGFDWAVSKIPFGSIFHKEIEYTSSVEFSWPRKLKRSRRPPSDPYEES